MSDVVRQAIQHGADCPPLEVLIEAMQNPAPGSEAIAEHTNICPACQTELTLFREFELAEAKPDERDALKYIVNRLQGKPLSSSLWATLRAFFTPLRVGGLALGAAALLTVVGITTEWQHTHFGSSPMSEGDALRSVTVRGVVPQGNIPSFPEEIRWDGVAGAAAYDVTVTEVDGNVVFHKSFTTTRLQTPAELHRIMVPGKTILLQVNAVNASGSFVAQSGTIRVSVRPDRPQGNQ